MFLKGWFLGDFVLAGLWEVQLRFLGFCVIFFFVDRGQGVVLVLGVDFFIFWLDVVQGFWKVFFFVNVSCVIDSLWKGICLDVVVGGGGRGGRGQVKLGVVSLEIELYEVWSCVFGFFYQQ